MQWIIIVNLFNAVIVSNITANKQLIVDKENGILFSDKRDLEEALCLTIDNSKIRLQLANQAKVTISSSYSFHGVADSYIGLYEDLCCV